MVSDIMAKAFVSAGAQVVTCVPGFVINEVSTAYCRGGSPSVPVSFHEDVAFSLAHGSAMVGKRSAAFPKSHGLAKTGNSVIDSLSRQ
jgi:TPP-dependent indolepyruvate ferredoxin oxidoreductase alpha subunit